jgi:ankyrin repeat protein
MQDLNRTLIVAAEGGDLPTVQSMLAAGADPNAMGPNSGALHCAAFGGYLDIVNVLLAGGADPNLADVKGLYPLQLAASKGHLRVMKALILADANLEAKTKAGGTALHVAAASDFPDAVALLLEVGADIEARDAGGNTPLATACSLGRKRVFELLRKEGTSLATLSNGMETLLIKTARGLRSLRVKGWFTSDGDIRYDIRNGFVGQTKGNMTSAVALADQRRLAKDVWEQTEHLYYLDACDLVDVLLGAGIDVNAVDEEGHTALSLACHAGESRVIETLLQAGASAKIKHGQGFTPLHMVAGSARLDGLETYLRLVPDADVMALDQYGWTPLHWLADIGGDIKMVELLLAKGADRSTKTTMLRGANMPAGMTAADVARHWRDAEMAAALEA